MTPRKIDPASSASNIDEAWPCPAVPLALVGRGIAVLDALGPAGWPTAEGEPGRGLWLFAERQVSGRAAAASTAAGSRSGCSGPSASRSAPAFIAAPARAVEQAAARRRRRPALRPRVGAVVGPAAWLLGQLCDLLQRGYPLDRLRLLAASTSRAPTSTSRTSTAMPYSTDLPTMGHVAHQPQGIL